jgi:hypothetical protein
MAKPPETNQEIIELLLEPIPPDTADTIKAELVSVVQEALREAGREHLLVNSEIRIEIEKTFPIDWVALSKIATVAVFALATDIAVENYKAFVIPAIKKRFKVKAEKRREKER